MRLLRAALPQWRLLRSTATVDAGGVSTSTVAPSYVKHTEIVGTKATHLRRNGSHEGYSALRILPYENGRKRTHTSSVEGSHKDTLNFNTADGRHSEADAQDDVTVQFANRDSVVSPWPCGTWDDPVPITSVTSSRAVACCGPPDGKHSHATVWIKVTEAHPVQCPTCRQVFKLSRRQS